MKTLLLIIPALLMAAQSFGQSYSVGVFVDTNGVLLYPTNLFQANSNRLNASVSAIQVNSNDVVRPNFISTGDISWTGVDSEFYGTINDGAVSSGKLDAALYSWLQALARVLVDSISASGFASGDDIEFYFDVSSNAIPRIKSGSLALSLVETNGFSVGQAPVFNGVTLEPGLILEANIDSAIARDTEMALLYQPLSPNLTQLAGLNGASLTNLNATNVVGVLSESNIDSAIMRDSEAALAFEPLNSGKYQATNSALTDFVAAGSTGSGAYARSNSPTFGGEPRVPTAAPGTSNTVAASTAFVADAVSGLGSGSGDVVGPSSSTTNNLAAFDGATGKLLKDSGIATTNVQTVTGSVAAFEPINASKYQATNSVLTDVIASGSTGSGAFVRSNAPTITDPTLLGTVNTQTNNVGYLVVTNFVGTLPEANIDAAIARDSEVSASYQPLDADLTDLADGSLTGSKVGTGISGDNITTGTVADARVASTLARLDSPALTGSPTVPTAAPGTSNTVAASTAFVMQNKGAGGSGASLSATNQWTAPQYFGTATANTPAAGDSSTNVATTKWIRDATLGVAYTFTDTNIDYSGTSQYTTNYITIPTNASTMTAWVINAGSGGGSGRVGTTNTVRCGGGGGGSPCLSFGIYAVSNLYQFGTNVITVFVSKRPAGGASQTNSDSNGNTGGWPYYYTGIWIGTNSVLYSSRGAPGSGGTSTTGSGGYAGVGGLANGVTGASASTSGGSGNGGSPMYNGAAGSGGAGGGLNVANTPTAGGDGGYGSWAGLYPQTRGAAGSAGGGAGTGQSGWTSLPNPFVFSWGGGAGGGGGGSSTNSNGGDGGPGVLPGAGGGGGGAAQNGYASGAGGAGGPCFISVLFN